MVKKKYFFGITFLILFFDQVTKYFVYNYLSVGKSIDYGFFAITRVHNKGAGFGLFKDFNLALAAFAVFALVISIYYFFKIRDSRLLVLLSLFIGGVAGNLVDRFRFGFVIDFIDLKIWPIFNIADACITISILLIIYLEFRKKGLK